MLKGVNKRHRILLTGRSVGRLDLFVDHLVTREKAQRVVVLMKRVDGGKNTLKVLGVIRRAGFVTVGRVQGVVDVENKVNACIGQLFHTLIMILRVVDHLQEWAF